MSFPARLAKALRRWCESHQETYDKLPEVKHYRFPVELDAVALMAQENAPNLFISYLALLESVVTSTNILTGQLENLKSKANLSAEQAEIAQRLSKHLPIYRQKPHLLVRHLLEAIEPTIGNPDPDYRRIYADVYKAFCKSYLANPDQQSHISKGDPSRK